MCTRAKNHSDEKVTRSFKAGVMLFLVCLTMQRPLFSAEITPTKNEINSAYATLAYDAYITSLKTQIRYETKIEDLTEREKERRDAETREFWEKIVLLIALGLACAR